PQLPAIPTIQHIYLQRILEIAFAPPANVLPRCSQPIFSLSDRQILCRQHQCYTANTTQQANHSNRGQQNAPSDAQGSPRPAQNTTPHIAYLNAGYFLIAFSSYPPFFNYLSNYLSAYQI